MNEQEFKRRTKQVGLRTINLIESLPNTKASRVIGNQILRSATSIGANYRAACRAKSKADMIAKLAIVEEESDETLYWLELLIEANLVSKLRLTDLMKEVDEIVAMTVTSIRTLNKEEKCPVNEYSYAKLFYHTASNPKSKI